jgi:hypothetical protein
MPVTNSSSRSLPKWVFHVVVRWWIRPPPADGGGTRARADHLRRVPAAASWWVPTRADPEAGVVLLQAGGPRRWHRADVDQDPHTHVVLDLGHTSYRAALHLDHKLLEEMLERPPQALTIRHTTTSHSFLHWWCLPGPRAVGVLFTGHCRTHVVLLLLVLSPPLEPCPQTWHDLAPRDCYPPTSVYLPSC